MTDERCEVRILNSKAGYHRILLPTSGSGNCSRRCGRPAEFAAITHNGARWSDVTEAGIAFVSYLCAKHAESHAKKHGVKAVEEFREWRGFKY